MEIYAVQEFGYLRAKGMECAHPLPRRTWTTSRSWRRFLNSKDCGLERPPWKISSEEDGDEVKDGESDGGIMWARARAG